MNGNRMARTALRTICLWMFHVPLEDVVLPPEVLVNHISDTHQRGHACRMLPPIRVAGKSIFGPSFKELYLLPPCTEFARMVTLLSLIPQPQLRSSAGPEFQTRLETGMDILAEHGPQLQASAPQNSLLLLYCRASRNPFRTSSVRSCRQYIP